MKIFKIKLIGDKSNFKDIFGILTLVVSRRIIFSNNKILSFGIGSKSESDSLRSLPDDLSEMSGLGAEGWLGPVVEFNFVIPCVCGGSVEIIFGGLREGIV